MQARRPLAGFSRISCKAHPLQHGGLRRSPRPIERREVAVVALAEDSFLDAEGGDAHLFRPRQGQAAVGRVTGVVDMHGLAIGRARLDAVDVEVQDAWDIDAAGEAVHAHRDGRAHDAAIVGDDVLADRAGRAAGGAAGDGLERLRLSFVLNVDNGAIDP